MARRKTKLTELIEFFFQKIDRRFSFGKQTGDVILSWAGKNPDGTDIIIDAPDGTKKKQQPNTKKLSLLRGLVLEYQVSHLDELPKKLENSDDFYVKGEEGNCVCGQPFSAEAVLLNIKGGNEAKKRIYGQIKAQKKIVARDSIAIGMDCYNGLPALLDELYIPNNLKQYRENEKKTKEEKLKDIIENISPELQTKLTALGFDTEALKKVLQLEHIHALLEGNESGVKFDIDPRNNTNTFNWFKGLKESEIRENIKEEYAEDLLQIWHRLNNAAHLLTDDDLAEIMVYSHEFRRRKTDLLLAGVKEDLFYLSKLDDNHPYIKQYGKVNLDKDFVLPQTKYRDRRKLEKRTIRQVLGEEKTNKKDSTGNDENSFVTRIEAMGIHNHFKDIIERRIAINRETAQKYGRGRALDYVIKAITPVFNKTKEDLHEEYKKWGEIVNEHMLTQDEYMLVKSFLQRSQIGQGTPRENYLRNHHIAYFNQVAPKIMKLGRKIKYARRMAKKGTQDDEFKALKQEYFLAEDFAEKFPEFTHIEGINSDKFFEMLENTGFVEHKEYQKFRQKAIGAYKFGIVPKELIAKTSQEKSRALHYYKLLQNHGVHEQSEKIQNKLKLIKERYDSGVIAQLGFAESLFESKYIDANLEKQINSIYNSVSYIKVPDSWEKIHKRMDELNNLEFLIFDKRGVQIKSNKGIKREEAAGVIYYDTEEVVSLLAEKDKSIPMPEEVVEKFKKIINRNYRNYLSSIYVSPDQEHMATQESIDAINERYAKLEAEIKQDDAKSKLNSCSTSLKMDYFGLEKLLSKMPKARGFLLSKYPEYANDTKFFEEMKKATDYKELDVEFVMSFDTKNSAIPKIKQEKSSELSLIIRQELANQIKDEESWKKELDKFYFDQIFPELQRDPAVRKLGQGLGMQKKTGERVLKAYDSEKWESFKPEYLKYNMRRVLQGGSNILDKTMRGEIAQYKLPEEMLARFEEDVKEKRFNESDADVFREALAKIEQIVNEKITNFYSISYQINRMLEKERDEAEKNRKNDDFYGGGNKKHYSSSRHSYHKRKFFGKRRW